MSKKKDPLAGSDKADGVRREVLKPLPEGKKERATEMTRRRKLMDRFFKVNPEWQ